MATCSLRFQVFAIVRRRSNERALSDGKSQVARQGRAHARKGSFTAAWYAGGTALALAVGVLALLATGCGSELAGDVPCAPSAVEGDACGSMTRSTEPTTAVLCAYQLRLPTEAVGIISARTATTDCEIFNVGHALDADVLLHFAGVSAFFHAKPGLHAAIDDGLFIDARADDGSWECNQRWAGGVTLGIADKSWSLDVDVVCVGPGYEGTQLQLTAIGKRSDAGQ